MFIVFLSMLYAPDLSRLGADDFQTREWESARLSNPLSALLLPWQHEDAEIEHRCWRIKRTQLRAISAEYRERVAYRDDYAAWFAEYWAPGKSRIAIEDVWNDIDYYGVRSGVFLDKWGDRPPHYVETFGWFMVPGTVKDFREYCDYHRRTAPAPHGVESEK